MRLTFHGTRGEIEASTRLHARHTATEVAYLGTRVLIDAGRDWLGRVPALRPHAIVVTHAHSDHVDGLRDGAPCEVWATADTSDALQRWPLDLCTVEPRRPFRIGRVSFEAFPVEHSVRAPAVGYRVTAGRVTVFYVPDVVDIPGREDALHGCRLYVGDGATLLRPILRRQEGRLVGHAPVQTQLAWCEASGVPRVIVTHCGSGIVKARPSQVAAKLRSMAAPHGIRADIAYDGMRVVLR